MLIRLVVIPAEVDVPVEVHQVDILVVHVLEVIPVKGILDSFLVVEVRMWFIQMEVLVEMGKRVRGLVMGYFMETMIRAMLVLHFREIAKPISALNYRL